MASPIEGIAGLGLQLTRQPDGTLQVRKLELEPRARRLATLIWTVLWIALGLFFTAGLYGLLPGNPEVTAAPGVREWLPPFFAATGLWMFYHLIWTRLGREEWRVRRNHLEVRQALRGLSRVRSYVDTDLAVRRYLGDTWLLEVGAGQRWLLAAELEGERLTALFDLGELIARETGWSLRVPERPAAATSAGDSGAMLVAARTGPPLAPGSLPSFSVDPGQRQQIEPELDAGERLLWTGQPDANRVARQAMPILLFGIPWTVGALYFGHPWTEDHLPFALFSGLFVIAGLSMCCTPLVSYRDARRSTYAITDRRVLIVTAGRERKVASYRAADQCEAERQEQPDGSGDLLFARQQEKDNEGGYRTVDVKFVGIPRVREVERLLRQLFPREVG